MWPLLSSKSLMFLLEMMQVGPMPSLVILPVLARLILSGCVRLVTETCRWTLLEDLEHHVVVDGAEAEAGLDPYTQDCISMNVKETVRDGIRMLRTGSS